MEFADDTLIKTRKQKTPFLLTDLSAIERNYVRLQRALPGSKIFFAIKSNYDPELIGRLNSIGSCFDVASWTEIDLCLKKGVVHPGCCSALRLRSHPRSKKHINPVYACLCTILWKNSKRSLNTLPNLR